MFGGKNFKALFANFYGFYIINKNYLIIFKSYFIERGLYAAVLWTPPPTHPPPPEGEKSAAYLLIIKRKFSIGLTWVIHENGYFT